MAPAIGHDDASAGLAAGAVEGCALKLGCARRWPQLEPLRGQPGVRFCGTCRRAVHWAPDEAALRRLLRLGKCVVPGWDATATLRLPKTGT